MDRLAALPPPREKHGLSQDVSELYARQQAAIEAGEVPDLLVLRDQDAGEPIHLNPRNHLDYDREQARITSDFVQKGCGKSKSKSESARQPTRSSSTRSWGNGTDNASQPCWFFQRGRCKNTFCSFSHAVCGFMELRSMWLDTVSASYSDLQDSYRRKASRVLWNL